MTTRSNNKKCNKEEIQATKDFVNYEKKWPTLSPQTSVNKSEELLEKLNQLNSKMSRLESIPNQISNMASTLKTVSKEVEQLHKEMKGLRKENNSLREKNQLLENKISSLEFDINDLEQYGRRQNLEIQGIPISDNENNIETGNKVLTVPKKIDENISHDDIDIAHRVGKSKTNKTPNIVRFVSRRTRNNIYNEKRKLKSNAPGKPTSDRVFINENLKRNKHLFSLANEERKKFSWKYIWTNNGSFLLRQSNDSRVIDIQSEKDIEHIKNPMANPRIPTKFLHLNQFEMSPILPFDMVSGRPVISLSWCVVLDIFLHLFNNHGFVQNL